MSYGEPPMLMVGESLAGRYELEEVVGIGGMSHVYRARDHDLDRTVAVKVLDDRLAVDDEAVSRFQREARMAAGLAHENIVTVIDRGDDDGRPFIVFEYFAGTTLKQLVRANGPLPIDHALGLAIQVARGLAFAHASGFIHRDVKPQNVLVDRKGRAKLTDFGIARSLEAAESATITGTVLGSADYIPPEQAQASPVDERSDVYSLGVVLYELLTGELPFRGESFVAVAMQHINEPPPLLRERRPETPPRLEAAISRALAKSPAHRFATMDAFTRELEACSGEPVDEDGDGGRTLVIPPPGRAMRRPRWRWVLAASVPVGIAFGILALVVAPGSKRPIGAGVPKAVAAVIVPVRLRAAAPYDPAPGDGVEDNSRLALATDSSLSTAWSTEWYASPRFGGLKPGVGIVLDAGRPVALRSVTVASDTPGFTGVIETAAAEHGPVPGGVCRRRCRAPDDSRPARLAPPPVLPALDHPARAGDGAALPRRHQRRDREGGLAWRVRRVALGDQGPAPDRADHA